MVLVVVVMGVYDGDENQEDYFDFDDVNDGQNAK